MNDLDEFGLTNKPDDEFFERALGRMRRKSPVNVVFVDSMNFVTQRAVAEKAYVTHELSEKSLLEILQRVVELNKKYMKTFPEVQRYKNFLDDYY